MKRNGHKNGKTGRRNGHKKAQKGTKRNSSEGPNGRPVWISDQFSFLCLFVLFCGHSSSWLSQLRAQGLVEQLGQLGLGGEADDLVQRLVAALEDQDARDGGHVVLD